MRRSAFIAGATGAAILGARATADAQLLPGQTYLQQLSIGVSVPLSGPLQKYGTQVVAGVRASIDYVNRYMSAMQGRIYGIRAFDDQDSSTVATTNVQIAANDPSVIAMIGNLTADVTITNIPNYQNVGFALIVPATTDDGVTDRGYRNVFRLPTKDITEGLLFARATLMGRKPVVAIAVALDDGYGYDVARGFTQQAKNDRHQADTMLFPAKGFDPANAARAVVAREPAFVFLAGRTSDLGPLAEALRLAGYIGEFGASNGFYGEATTASYATVMANALVSTSLPPLDKIPDQIQQYTFLGNQTRADHGVFGVRFRERADRHPGFAAGQRDDSPDPPERAADRRHLRHPLRTVLVRRERRPDAGEHLSLQDHQGRLRFRQTGHRYALRDLSG